MADHVDEVLAQWSRQRPDLDTAPMAVLGRLSRLTQVVEARQRATFAAHDLDAASFDVLATLRRSDPPHELTPGRLAASSMVTSGAVTQRLDRLEARGLVRRRRGDVDTRTVLVSLTEAGRAAVEGVLPDHLATGRDLLGPLDDDQRAQLADLLRALLTAHEAAPDPDRTGAT
ncbi:MarR family winged helix-turn-helix transcriptional regulator [uncultured Pseudokineococcus sp.]|uniref:MarR family winged helix-turn-helix transcriptional regulator n=1 Tax=uncultured Pseudokineococcus sp. TaxID=1642928 RepID=UPI00263040C4|nr:MarR family transcriptional regulator [uncultured Pseudokineococcus sp.]